MSFFFFFFISTKRKNKTAFSDFIVLKPKQRKKKIHYFCSAWLSPLRRFHSSQSKQFSHFRVKIKTIIMLLCSPKRLICCLFAKLRLMSTLCMEMKMQMKNGKTKNSLLSYEDWKQKNNRSAILHAGIHIYVCIHALHCLKRWTKIESYRKWERKKAKRIEMSKDSER